LISEKHANKILLKKMSEIFVCEGKMYNFAALKIKLKAS
jgi:hypothetical protein